MFYQRSRGGQEWTDLKFVAGEVAEWLKAPYPIAPVVLAHSNRVLSGRTGLANSAWIRF